MKKLPVIALTFAFAFMASAATNDASPASTTNSTGSALTNALPQLTPDQLAQAQRRLTRQATRQAALLAAAGATPATTPAAPKGGLPTAQVATAPVKTVATNATEGIRLNFRNAPLDLILTKLSEDAGFVIVPQVPVRGTMDVYSSTPVTEEEAINLLNSGLAKNGLAALRNGKILTIVEKESASKNNTRIVKGGDPDKIDKTSDVVTQIIPVKSINATQLSRDLATLLPPGASLVPNEGGNALIMTDSQINIRRVVEIVSALDSQVSGSTMIRVYALKFGDAKALATTIKDLFTDTSATAGRGNAAGGAAGGFAGGLAAFAGGFGGGAGGFGGGRGGGGNVGGGGGRGTGGVNAVATANKVVAVSDEHSNSLIVSANESQFTAIEELIKKVDTDVQDLTELRVFHLKNADPTEMTELLTGIFPDPSKQDDTRGGGIRFGGGFGFGGQGGRGGGAATTTTVSDRAKKQGRVLSVPDPRTRSIVVSAAKELMPQIAEMVAQLDNDASRKKHVETFALQSGDPDEVKTLLNDLFASSNGRSSASSQNNALSQRQTQTIQNQSRSTSSSGLGGSSRGLGQ